MRLGVYSAKKPEDRDTLTSQIQPSNSGRPCLSNHYISLEIGPRNRIEPLVRYLNLNSVYSIVSEDLTSALEPCFIGMLCLHRQRVKIFAFIKKPREDPTEMRCVFKSVSNF